MPTNGYSRQVSLSKVRAATRLAAASLACVAAASSAALADDEAAGPKDGVAEQSIANELPGGGDPGGVRKLLSERGIDYGFNYVGQVQGNVSGGFARRTTYIGRLEGYVDLDFEKIAGWKGLTVHTAAFQLHGNGLATTAVGSLMPPSFIEAHPTTRLFELWAEQRLLDDKLAIRFGQLAVDSEFFTSGYAGQFINATFGWPAIDSTNHPSGGVAYPLASPAVRVQVNPVKSLSLLAGVYDGDPAGPCRSSVDPQECNRYGTNFRLSDPPFVIGELQYRYNQEKGAPGLAGTIKVGGWHHFSKFDDRRFGTDGILLADTANSNGIPLRHTGLSGIYGIIDQQIWRPASGEPDKGIGVFTRVSASPEHDRNDLGFYIDGGIVFAGLVPHRPDDIVSFGAAYTRFTSGARGADADAISFGALQPVRDHEALLEFNYQAQVISGWTIDADVQYVLHPGGNVANPLRYDGTPLKDATILTLHTLLKY